MRSRAGIALLPLVIAALATGAGLAAMSYLALSPLQAAFAAAAVFCVLTVLALYIWMTIHIGRFARRIDGTISFEDNIVGRLQDIERDAGKMGEKLGRRIDKLANNQQALSASVSENAPEPLQQVHGNIDTALSQPDNNVVPLNPSTNHASNPKAKADNVSKRKSVTVKIDRALNGGMMTIRLQPILNLIDKEIIALEAFAFFKIEESFIDGREFVGRMTELQCSRYDLKVIHALSTVIREMAQDGQALPIHYKLVSMASSADANWLEMTQALKGDPKLVAKLVPVIPQTDYSSMDNKAFEKFLNLRELGLRPCLGGITDVDSALETATLKHFKQFKVNAETLLKYRSSETERIADRLLPGLLKVNARIFTSGITTAYQASQLIDLDLIAGQGNYICEPKRIRLYKDVEEAETAVIADGTIDKTS